MGNTPCIDMHGHFKEDNDDSTVDLGITYCQTSCKSKEHFGDHSWLCTCAMQRTKKQLRPMDRSQDVKNSANVQLSVKISTWYNNRQQSHTRGASDDPAVSTAVSMAQKGLQSTDFHNPHGPHHLNVQAVGQSSWNRYCRPQNEELQSTTGATDFSWLQCLWMSLEHESALVGCWFHVEWV